MTETKVELRVRGTVNGGELRAEGASVGVVGAGDIRANLCAQVRPSGLELGLLPYVLLTGQPSLSRVLAGAYNPFIATGGAYEAVRTLDLGNAGALHTEYSVDQSGADALRASFFITGDVRTRSLTRILPALETWCPAGPGAIVGHFSMVWECDDGSFLKGEATTAYRLPRREALHQPAYRSISIDMSYSPEQLSQEERIVLMSEDGFRAAVASIEHVTV